jgi:hypothetical protein
VPGSLEADPVAAEVSVSVVPGGAAARVTGLELAGVAAHPGTALRMRGHAPARAPWEVSFSLRPGANAPVAATAALAPLPGGTGESAVALGLCRAGEPREGAAPERVLLLIDRSRSVGPAGISLERDLGRALLEALPPSVRFNAVFFDRGAAPLFPVARAATEEALAAFEAQAGPGQLGNGTSLPHALKTATDLARFEGEARTWLVLITDGAIPESERAEALLAATASLPPARTDALVLVVRPGGDEPAPGPAQEVLRALPGRLGGVLRTVDPADLRGAVAEVVTSARRGGDLFAVSVGAPGGKRTEAFSAVPPAAGDTRIFRAPTPGPLVLSGRHAGEAFTAPLAVRALARATLAPHLGGAAAAWTGRDPRLLAWVETAAGPPPLADDVPRGQMDRTVVRNALSLAYMPRARACYLSRRVRGADDIQLRGRLRLELHLERGEMLEAVVRRSSLNRPEIEACLREAAFGVEIPRPLHRDAPVIAILNLIFQPRTPPPGAADASALSREIDLLLGPITFPSDPRDLLDEPAAP